MSLRGNKLAPARVAGRPLAALAARIGAGARWLAGLTLALLGLLVMLSLAVASVGSLIGSRRKHAAVHPAAGKWRDDRWQGLRG